MRIRVFEKKQKIALEAMLDQINGKKNRDYCVNNHSGGVFDKKHSFLPKTKSLQSAF